MQTNLSKLCSLQRMSYVVISVALWTRRTFKTRISQFDFSLNPDEQDKEWKKMENEVLKMALELPLPQKLKKLLYGVVKAIGFELLDWVQFHKCIYRIISELPEEVCWTSLGIIDGKRTAETLVKDCAINIHTRYLFACYYCFEHYIRELWPQIKSSKKEDIFIVKYWCSQMDNQAMEKEKHRSSNENVRQLYASATSGTETACRYFVQKLQHEKREKVLTKVSTLVADQAFHYGWDSCYFRGSAGILLLLISHMNEEKLKQLHQDVLMWIILRCMTWPLQEHCLKLATNMWSYFSEFNYRIILFYIVSKMTEELEYYEELFESVWQNVPDKYKGSLCSQLLFHCLLNEIDNCFKFVVTILTVTDKENLTLVRDDSFKICLCLIEENKWQLLEMFIQEFATSKETTDKLRGDCEYILKRVPPNKNLEKKLSQLFNDTSSKIDIIITQMNSLVLEGP